MIVRMTIDHALYVSRRMRDVDYREVMAMRWDDDSDAFALDMYRMPGPAFAAINNRGYPAAIGGIALHTPKVGTAWMVGTEHFQTVALAVTRHTRSIFARLFNLDEVNRIHAWSAAFHTDAHKWLECFGMARVAGWICAE